MEKEFFVSAGKKTVPCLLTLPDVGEVHRLVLSIHGIGGSSQDKIQMYIAEEMSLFGYAVLRFDFPGHGKAQPEPALCLADCREVLSAVACYARDQFPDVEELCVFASGFGAYVLLTELPQLRQMWRQLRIVLQTPAVRMHETILRMKNISRETLWALEWVNFPAPRPFGLTYRFYEELAENNILINYDIPFLILHGELDEYIRASDIQQFRRVNERSKLVLLPGVGHRFLEKDAWDMVLDLTRDWFDFQQVLVTDWE